MSAVLRPRGDLSLPDRRLSEWDSRAALCAWHSRCSHRHLGNPIRPQLRCATAPPRHANRRGQFCELNVTLCDLLPGQTADTQSYCANGGASPVEPARLDPLPLTARRRAESGEAHQAHLAARAGRAIRRRGNRGHRFCRVSSFVTRPRWAATPPVPPHLSARRVLPAPVPGTCSIPTGGNVYVCRCPPLFAGQHCERRTFVLPPPAPVPTGLNRVVEVPGARSQVPGVPSRAARYCSSRHAR